MTPFPPKRLPFPPCGGRMRSLSEQRELRRSWMGGAAARALEVKRQRNAPPMYSLVCHRAAAPPIPTFPHKGGRGSSEWESIFIFSLATLTANLRPRLCLGPQNVPVIRVIEAAVLEVALAEHPADQDQGGAGDL